VLSPLGRKKSASNCVVSRGRHRTALGEYVQKDEGSPRGGVERRHSTGSQTLPRGIDDEKHRYEFNEEQLKLPSLLAQAEIPVNKRSTDLSKVSRRPGRR
jgi:hypothetical protein